MGGRKVGDGHGAVDDVLGAPKAAGRDECIGEQYNVGTHSVLMFKCHGSRNSANEVGVPWLGVLSP